MLSFLKKLRPFDLTSSAPLATFRIFFGLMMLFSLIRFWSNGWIETLYIDPNFHFKYFGFSWVSDWGSYTYLLFIICGLSTIFITLGLFYRYAIVIFFLSFKIFPSNCSFYSILFQVAKQRTFIFNFRPFFTIHLCPFSPQKGPVRRCVMGKVKFKVL